MENIIIAANKRTPAVSFEFTKGELSITGRSIPEDAFAFYSQLLLWLENYTHQHTAPQTTITISLDYYNTSSSMYLLNMLKILDELAAKGHPVLLKWYFYEEDVEGWVETFEESLIPMLKHVQSELIHFKE
ncbi:DUF1987 domain-containing protein [Eisenibacter elegans]|jgi:hypothetical protein|uniref:DUF1987 domain-containing protein n=1 Tax=Eisenibacter elegans TaxID=997 RepID=UPI00042610AA|nr:DUF1987 domain-containing protein [Eisenibacter elegans]